MNDEARPRMVLLGRVLGAFGVRGELKVDSFTDPVGAILRYRPWILRDARGAERTLDGVRGRESPRGVVASLPGIDDRDAAEAMRGTEILVLRDALPPPGPDEYYWIDLEGLRVVTLEGVELGTVSHLLATGANDVLVARSSTPGNSRERMIPFLEPQYIRSVDFESGVVTVDWDPEF